jgi:DNA polymerase-4
MARAVRLCPSLAVVKPDFARYQDVSNQVFDLFREVTPLVEPLSLDEAYLDVTHNSWQEALGMRVARRLKDEIRARTQLTASAGVAPNKFLAKIASGWQKPDGLTVSLRAGGQFRKGSMPMRSGRRPVTARKLRAVGIAGLADASQPEHLWSVAGSPIDWRCR